MKKMLAALAATFGVAYVYSAEILDECFQFQTFGYDCYENGDPLMEGECYALVWRHNDFAKSIEGLFTSEGKPVDPAKCEILGVFNSAAQSDGDDGVFAAATNSWIVLPAGHYSAHKDSGVYSVFIFDTRIWDGGTWVLGGKASDKTVASLRYYGLVKNLEDIKLGTGKNNPYNGLMGTFFSYNVAMYGREGFIGDEDHYTSFGDYTEYFSYADTPVVQTVAKIGEKSFDSADAAFAEAEEKGGKVEILASCSFANSYCFTNADVEISVAEGVTLERLGKTNYPFLVANFKTLTFSGAGTIHKGDKTACGSSTLISIGNADGAVITSNACGHVVINGGNLIDEGGSNACSIDCGTFVMNGGYVKSGNAAGHAVRVSSTIADGSAAIVTLNAGKLEAANSAIGVKIADGGTPTITAVPGKDDTAIITGVKSKTTYAGTITMNLTAGENLLFSNDKSEFAPRGYGYVASETETGWFKLGLADYTISVEGGTIAGGESKTYAMNKEAAQDFALVAGAAPSGKKFEKWTLTAITHAGENVTLADATAASTTLTVGAGAIGNFTVSASWVNDIQPVPPGEDVDVPAGKTVQEFVDDINTNVAVKAKYLKAPDSVETTPAYLSYFGAVRAGDGKVAFELNEAGTNAVVAAQDEAKEAVLTSVLAATGSGELSIAEPIKGFYYCLVQQEELTGEAKPSVDEKLAGRDKVTFGLTKWTKSGFYQMRVSPKSVAADVGSLGQ